MLPGLGSAFVPSEMVVLKCVCVCCTGRMFDFHVLDMFELGIEKFTSLSEVKVRHTARNTHTLLEVNLNQNRIFLLCVCVTEQ